MGIMEFREWMMEKFREWENTQPGKRSNYSAFARHLGIKVNQYAQWRSGNNYPSPEAARILAKKLGNEVYAVLGYPIPEELDPFSSLPPELRAAVKRANDRIASLGLPVNLSTSVKILAEEISPFESIPISRTDNEGSTK